MLALALGAASVSPVFCQPDFENPAVYKLQADLGQNFDITDIAEDHLGFTWISTTQGLFRFDGTQMQFLGRYPLGLDSLTQDFIVDLAYDVERRVFWLASRLGKLYLMDIHTGKHQLILDEEDETNPLATGRFLWLLQDGPERIWAGGEDGLQEFHIPGRKVRLHTFPPALAGNDAGLLKKIHGTRAGHQDRFNDSLLWIASGGGLLEFNKYTGDFHRYAYSGRNAGTNVSNNLRSLYQHTDGALYCGTYGFGLLRFDPATAGFRHVEVARAKKNYDLWKNVFDIVPKSANELWVTTMGGLAVLNTQTMSLNCFAENELEYGRNYGVRYLDNAGRRWNWENDKLILFNPLVSQIQPFQCPKTIGGQQLLVRKIEEDPDNGLLYMAAQYSGGLLTLNRESKTWAVIPPARTPGKRIESFPGRDLIRTRQGAWLILTDRMIYRLSPDQKQLLPFSPQPSVPDAYFRSVLEDRQGNLWIGSHYEGIFRITPEDDAIRVFREELETPGFPDGSTACEEILEDRLGHIWIRHAGGYSVYVPEKDSFQHIFSFGKYKQAKVKSFAEDQTGRIWIAGEEYGLGLADPLHPEMGLAGHLTPGEPLKTATAHWVLADSKNRIWVASTETLECLSQDLKSSSGYFTVDHGVPNEIFSMALLSSGQIAIGHRGGISIFHPDSLKRNTESPVPYISAFQVFEQEFSADTLPPFLQDVRLAHDQNYLSIEFSAIGYNLPRRQVFEYQLRGIDPNWINPGKRRYVSYTNLKSGDYEFLLRVANSEGKWSERPLSLRIHIAKPWWNTWWAYALYVLIAGGLLRAISSWRRRRRQLKIELALEHREAERLKELDAFKTRLYTNITHEFRTPLTVILGLAEQLHAGVGEAGREKLAAITRSGKSLLRLINQMLDLSKLESGLLPLHFVCGDIIPFLKYQIESFHGLAESKDVRLEFQSEAASLVMDYDPDRMETIVWNLVSNALKFTSQGLVEVSVALAEKSTFMLRVKDTGAGIPADKLPYIFDRFYQVEPASNRPAGRPRDTATAPAEGTGIGLALTKELVKLLGGEISVKSEPGAGTEFSVLLPVTKNAPLAEWKRKSPDEEPVQPSLAGAGLSASREAPLPTEAPILLVVEDNADVVSYLRSLLHREYRIEVAGNGQEGLAKALELVPDLVLSDVMMPGMGGFELCEKLKTDIRTSHIPVVLLTARADTASRIEGLQHGADAYLGKPFQKEELLVRLKKLIELRKYLQARYANAGAKLLPPHSPTMEDTFMLQVRGILNAHLGDEEFDIVGLCKALGMSRAQLYRKFQALTDQPVAHFFRSMRLHKAQELLRSTDLQVAEIAFQVGFKDPAHFSRAFAEEFGASPREWRKGQ